MRGRREHGPAQHIPTWSIAPVSSPRVWLNFLVLVQFNDNVKGRLLLRHFLIVTLVERVVPFALDLKLELGLFAVDFKNRLGLLKVYKSV